MAQIIMHKIIGFHNVSLLSYILYFVVQSSCSQSVWARCKFGASFFVQTRCLMTDSINTLTCTHIHIFLFMYMLFIHVTHKSFTVVTV